MFKGFPISFTMRFSLALIATLLIALTLYSPYLFAAGDQQSRDYGSKAQQKRSYGSKTPKQRIYGKASAKLDPNAVLLSEGTVCIPIAVTQSPYIAAACVSDLEVMQRSNTLLGEPVLNVSASYKVAGVVFRTEYRGSRGEQNGNKDYVRGPKTSLRSGTYPLLGDAIRQSLQSINVIDMDVALAVVREVSDNMGNVRAEYISGSPYLVQDIGATAKSGGKQSFNVAGSPEWDELFIKSNSFLSGNYGRVSLNDRMEVDWPIRRTARQLNTCRLRQQKPASGNILSNDEAYLTREEARPLFGKPYRLKYPGVCTAKFGGFGQVNDAIQNLCAAKVAKGEDATHYNQFLLPGYVPCKGDEKPTWGGRPLMFAQGNTIEATNQNVTVSGTVSPSVPRKDLAIQVKLASGWQRVPIKSDGSFDVAVTVGEGKSTLKFRTQTAGIGAVQDVFISYDPSAFPGFSIKYRYNTLASAYDLKRFSSSRSEMNKWMGLVGAHDALRHYSGQINQFRKDATFKWQSPKPSTSSGQPLASEIQRLADDIPLTAIEVTSWSCKPGNYPSSGSGWTFQNCQAEGTLVPNNHESARKPTYNEWMAVWNAPSEIVQRTYGSALGAEFGYILSDVGGSKLRARPSAPALPGYDSGLACVFYKGFKYYCYAGIDNGQFATDLSDPDIDIGTIHGTTIDNYSAEKWSTSDYFIVVLD